MHCAKFAERGTQFVNTTENVIIFNFSFATPARRSSPTLNLAPISIQDNVERSISSKQTLKNQEPRKR